MKSIFYLLTAFFLVSCASNKSSDPVPTTTVTLDFITPTNDTLYNNDKNTFLIRSTAQITKAEYYFNSVSIGSSIGGSFSIDYTFNNVSPGSYDLTCVVTSGNQQYTKTKRVVISLRLGDEFQGGKIFSLSNDKKSGLIASKSDYSTTNLVKFPWGPASLTGAVDLNNGKSNSATLLANAGSNPSFFWMGLKSYTFNGYSDWYVPSYNEMGILKTNMALVGNFPTSSNEAIYWTSTETDASTAYGKNLLALMGEKGITKTTPYRLRLIRSF